MSEADYLDSQSDQGAEDAWRLQQGQSRLEAKILRTAPKNKKGMTGKYWMKCHCGAHYEAKGADLGRGWGFSCSKRCSAARREFGKQKAQILGQVNTPNLKQPAKKSHTTEVILVDRETGEVIETNKY